MKKETCFFTVSAPYLRKDFKTLRPSCIHHSLRSWPDQLEGKKIVEDVLREKGMGDRAEEISRETETRHSVWKSKAALAGCNIRITNKNK